MAFITGSDASDNLVGTGENDTFLGAGGSDIINGGGGFDIVVYWSSPFAVGIRLFANVTDNDGFGGTDQLFGISGAAGSGWNDIIFGNDFGNLLLGLTGDDSIFGLGGDDLIRGAEGNDSLDGGAGTDRLFLFGNRADYTITASGDGFIIQDSFPAGRSQDDGRDTVTGFEEFQFADRRIAVANILDPNAPGIIDEPPPPPPPPGPSPVGGFAPANLVSNEFGFSASAGGWAGNDIFPRMMADVNGDGRDDIVGFGSDGVLVSLNNGAGGFGAATFASREFGFSASAGGWASNDIFPRMMADVNGDGRDDIVGFGSDGVLVSLNNGAGGFGAATFASREFGFSASAGGWASNDIFPRMMADVNGDGRDDIVGFGSDGVLVSLNNGAGGFGAATFASREFGFSASAGGWASNDIFPRMMADVNGDGRDDIVGFGSDGVLVSLNNGAGGFGAATFASREFGFSASAGGWASNDIFPRMMADVNGDGRDDIVGFGSDGVLVALARADGTFGAAQLRTNAFGFDASAGGWSDNNLFPRTLADLNADGRDDIVGFGNSGVLAALSTTDWI